MITHDTARALVSARYDQLLSPAETREVQEHLAACPACRQFAAETDLLVHGLRSLPQLPPSPRVSRAVREGIRGGASPWGWLGQGMRIATSPALAVASSFVLIAALAFIVILALRPLGIDEQPRATISAMAIDERELSTETPTPEPVSTIGAPTAVPTEATDVIAPTQEPTPTPAPPRTNVTPPATNTPVPTEPAAPTPAPTETILTETEPTASPEPTPAPTEAPPPAVREINANQAVEDETEAAPTAEPTSPPIEQAGDGAPFGSEQEVTVAAGSEEPPAVAQPTIGLGGPPAGVPGDDVDDGEAEAAAVMSAADDAQPGTEPAPAPNAAETPPAETAVTTEPAAPRAAPTSTPVQIVAQSETPPLAADPAPAPQLPERDGNEAIAMDGQSMAAEIQATVQAGLNDDSGPPTVPVSTAPPQPALTEAAIVPMTPTPEAAITSADQPPDAEITGAPAAELDPAASGAAAETEAAPVTDAAGEAPAAPQALGAPEPAWPGIGGGGTQYVSSAGYSAVADGGGVSIYGPDGAPLGVVGGGIPSWAPWGTSVLVIGASGQGAVWDTAQGLMPVEPAATAARDVPVGWLNGSPLVQRVYLDGSGLVELRVVPVGGGGYPIWSGTSDSVFGEGVTAARLSPDGGQISFVSGGQFYIAPVSDPGSAAPAG